MRISLGDVSLWFDVSGPSVIPQGDTTVERPVLVAVHGGPGLDHITVKSALAPLAEDFQVLYFDLRGHGRSDHSSAEFWNLRTWADDLRRLCDALGLRKPVILGSSFGGTSRSPTRRCSPITPAASSWPTQRGPPGPQRVIEAFGRLGGDEAAAVVRRIFAGDTEVSQADFNRVCYPLYSGTPGWAEESRQWMARTIRSTDVGSYYSHEREIQSFDPWSVLGAVRCPMLVLAGEDDPICPLPVVEELVSQLPKETTHFVRLPGARHTIFRDRPDLAFPAVRNFVSQIGDSQPAS